MTNDESETDSPNRKIDGRIDTLRRARPPSSARPTGSPREGTTAPHRARSDGGRTRGDATGENRRRGEQEDRRDGAGSTEPESEDESDGDADEADADDAESDEPTADEADAGDDREEERANALSVELDPFVRALAVRRAEDESTFDAYVVESVKTYLASMLGGSVSAPDVVGADHSLEVDADPVLDALLSDVAGENSVEETLIRAFAEQHDIPLETQSVSVAGLRAHEALLNGVVANTSNDLDSQSEVVQAALEARLGVADEEEA